MSIEVNPQGDGGLSQVHHDNTLTGTGADSDNPLRVAVPFTQALKAKLEGLSTADADTLGQAMLDVMAQGRVISDRQWVDYSLTTDASNQILVSVDNASPPFSDADNFLGMFANYSSSKDKPLLDSIDAGDVVLVTDAVSPTQWLVFRVAGTEYATGSNVNAITIWFGDADVLYKSGLDEYDDNWTVGDTAKVYIVKQMLDADGTNVGQALRSALPTGTAIAENVITNATEMLLSNFDGMTVGEFVRHHDQSHVGTYDLTGYAFTTSGISNLASDSGKIAWTVDGEGNGTILTQPKTVLDQNALMGALTVGKKVTMRLSEGNERTGKVKTAAVLSESNEPYKNTIRVDVESVVTVGTLTNNHAATFVVESNIPARDEVRDGAYKENPMTLLGAGDQQAFSSTTWESYSSATFGDDDIIHFCVGTSADGFSAVSCVRFGDISTTGVQIASNFNARRSGANLQIKRTAGTDTLYVRVLVVGNNSA